MEESNPKTNNKYKEFSLTGELINQYITKCLNMGNTLAGELLVKKNFNLCTKMTLLPSGFDPTNIKNYSYGGIFPAGPASPEEIEKVRKRLNLGPSARIEAVGSGPSRAWLINKIAEYLGKDKNRLVIFEDACASPTDPWIQRTNTEIYIFKEEVYHGLFSECANDKQYIEKTIKRAESAYLLIGVMSLLFDRKSMLTKQLNLDIIKNIAENTIAVILRAFDGEGYIICSFRNE
jgi:hypothetical protein